MPHHQTDIWETHNVFSGRSVDITGNVFTIIGSEHCAVIAACLYIACIEVCPPVFPRSFKEVFVPSRRGAMNGFQRSCCGLWIYSEHQNVCHVSSRARLRKYPSVLCVEVSVQVGSFGHRFPIHEISSPRDWSLSGSTTVSRYYKSIAIIRVQE